MKILFFGTDYYATLALKPLIEQGATIVGVVTGFSKATLPFPYQDVAEIAQEHSIPIFRVKNKKTLLVELYNLKALSAEIGLVASFGIIIPEQIFMLPKYGTLNIHPSLLPLYRGPAPVEQTILDGHSNTGVTLISITNDVDAGDIHAQKEYAVDPTDTSLTLATKLFLEGTRLFMELIQKFHTGGFPKTSQNHDKATFTHKYTDENARIDWNKSSQEIYNLIRAYYPKPIAWTFLGEFVSHYSEKEIPTSWTTKRVKIHAATLQDSVVTPTIIQVEGKQPIMWPEFTKGYLS